jgi:hypothetical protein
MGSMMPRLPADAPWRQDAKALYNTAQCGRGGIGRRNGLKLEI